MQVGTSDSTPQVSTSTFPLLNLPFELRKLVYKEYFGIWFAMVRHDGKSDQFRLTGIPDCSLLLSSHQVHCESKCVRDRCFGGRLVLKDAKVCRKRGFGFRSSVEVVESLGIGELLAHVDTISICDGTTGMLGMLPWHKLPKLKTVELEDSIRSNPFAVGLVSQIWPFESSKDRHGSCQICGVHGWNNWTQVPECVSEGRVRVISVRKGFVSGACHKAVVEHKSDRGEFIERICEDATGTWKWIMSESGSL